MLRVLRCIYSDIYIDGIGNKPTDGRAFRKVSGPWDMVIEGVDDVLFYGVCLEARGFFNENTR